MKKAHLQILGFKSQPRRNLLMSNKSNDYLYTISKTAIQTHQVDNLSEIEELLSLSLTCKTFPLRVMMLTDHPP